MSNSVHPEPAGDKPAETAHPQQGYPPQGYPPQGYPPQGYPPQGYPPQGYPPAPVYSGQQYPPQYPPPTYQQQQHHQHAIVMQPTVTVVSTQQKLGRSPVSIMCPHCSTHVTTAVSYKTGGFTWLLAVLLFLFGLSLGCCLIPFCVRSCKDAHHSCPNCHRTVGVKKIL